jgi:hypothetical protein
VGSDHVGPLTGLVEVDVLDDSVVVKADIGRGSLKLALADVPSTTTARW